MFGFKTDRAGTRSYKLEESQHYSEHDAMALGCADFDYDVPEELSMFVEKRAAHRIYGYTNAPKDLKQHICAYYRQRHELEIAEDDIMLAAGVLSSVGVLLQLFTHPGDAILLIEPEYPPFFELVKRFQLKPRTVRLQGSELDYDELKQKLEGAKVLLVSNPHNPTGNAFDTDRICKLCKESETLFISDEIWADFQLSGPQHASAYSHGFPTLLAPSKTFNMPGIPFSIVLWRDGTRLKQMRDFTERLHMGPSGCFAESAADVVYEHCSYWVDGLLELIRANAEIVKSTLGTQIGILGGEKTCLMFLDFSRHFATSAEARLYFIEHGVYMQGGDAFYCDGACPGAWLRINIGSPTSMIREAVQKIAAALLARAK